MIARWWARVRRRQRDRLIARRHLATVAHALWTGSTEAYTFVQDLPRVPDSTTVDW